MQRIISGLLLLVAAIHLLPISGFAGAERLTSLYGIEIADGNLEILMRHRAVLFGLLGGFIAYSAFKPALQSMAFVAAFVSLATFLYLTFSVGNYNDAIHRVAVVDVVAFVALIVAVALYVSRSSDTER